MTALLAKFVGIFTAMVMFFMSVGDAFSPSKDIPDDIENCKNVILLIGDGMGFNSIEKTRAEEGIDCFNMDRFPLTGASKTRSSSSSVTDSAAGGTALACGIRTTNGYVGVYPSDMNHVYSNPMSLAELAVSRGKLAGVITSDSTSGATPSSFIAHTSDRGNEEDITEQQLNSAFTLIWGTSTASFSEQTAVSNGFEVVYNKADMDALEEGSRSFAQFTSSVWHSDPDEGMPTMAEMTAKAIDLIDDDEDGFFLMVEGAHIDKNSHNNEGEGMKDALLAFDEAVGVALDYAKENGDTLVVVTADHETGGITLNDGVYEYTQTSHSGADVPLLVYGCDSFIEQDEHIKNKEVSRRIAAVMGEENFPIAVNNAEPLC